jgi:polar amino acid transport system substrate-binding protein
MQHRNMQRKLGGGCFGIVIALAGFAYSAAVFAGGAPLLPNSITVVTEELPPFNYTDNGKLVGFSTEVVEAVLKEVGIQGVFSSMAWARAYDTALTGENILIYSIARSPQREKLFKWVGVVAPTDNYIFALRERGIKLTTLEEAKKYKIGTVNEDIREQYLVSKGFVKGENLQPSTRFPLMYDKLKAGRIDLCPVLDVVLLDLARRNGDDAEKLFERVLTLPEIGRDGTYMAFGANTSDALVERFRKGLDTLKKNGTYAVIKKRWM